MKYDFIISGAGCAGLSFIHYLLQSPLKDKKVLVIDASDKKQNDRTWCYWSKSPLDIHPKKDQIISWNNIIIQDEASTVNKNLDGSKYFHIKSSDFYDEILGRIKMYPNIEFLHEQVKSVTGKPGSAIMVETVSSGSFECHQLINSIPNLGTTMPQPEIKQVFLGWEIVTDQACFDPNAAVLMNFKNLFADKVNFIYLLPFSEKHALIEFTVLAPESEQEEKLEEKIKAYIKESLGIDQYAITFVEKGSIPMTTQQMPEPNVPNWFNIGSIANCTKASTGYTFYNIQKQCQELIARLSYESNAFKKTERSPRRFRFYDNIILNIIAKWPAAAPAVFKSIFASNPADQVLKFLDEETTLAEEIKMLSRLPFRYFVKSLLHYGKY
ncbi:lycopene cyclase family protein [Pararhodonellum marinum]|uniref:lycopene cyclase family protein n=1 Tax=Pararhodonellum marinum TaxID=2755358 RepID=UPI00188EB73E|nr:lycopene cyclase family protein [Pararhodonellum marinum]